MLTQNNFSNLKDLLTQKGLSHRPVAAIGGFDSVSGLAQFISNAGFKIVAVSDGASGLVDYGGNGGLNVSRLISFKNAGHDFNEFKMENVKNTQPDFLMKMEVDVLVPEIVRGVLNGQNAPDVRAKVVLQTKRGLITKEAREILKQKQIPIILLSSQ